MILRVGKCYGRLRHDGLLAAAALMHDLTLVTHNDRDVAGLGSRVMNPFGAPRESIDRRIGKFRMTSRVV